MKRILTTLAITTTFTLIGCNKTEKMDTESTTSQPEEIQVQVEANDDEIILNFNGEERVIVLCELLEGIDVDGEMEIHVVINGEEVKDLPEDIMGHVMQMIGSGEHGEHGEHGGMDFSLGPKGDSPKHGQMRMIRMMQGDNDSHGDMEGMHNRMMKMHGGPRDQNQGEWQEREIPEVHQFIEELSLLNIVSDHLGEPEAVSLLGIHMIRDSLEGVIQMNALTEIIEDAALGSPARNAALIVAIQVQQNAGNIEEAAKLMVDLVLSN